MEAAERRVLATRNRERMQRSSLSSKPVGPTPAAADSRHQGRQMGTGNRQEAPPVRYMLGAHESSLEVHSRAYDVHFRVKGAEAWKQQVAKEQRAHNKALVLADPLPRPPPTASGRGTPRGPDHLRHVGRPASPPPPTREETLRRLRTEGHRRQPEHVASHRIGARARRARDNTRPRQPHQAQCPWCPDSVRVRGGAGQHAAMAPPVTERLGARELQKMHAGVGLTLLYR